jgi:short-subunit dehydrogenase
MYSVSLPWLVFRRGCNLRLRKKGINVTTVIPGLMRTGSPVNALFKGNYRSEYRWFSFLDSLPLISIDSKKAASKIIESCRHGAPVLVITFPAHVAMVFKALFPFLSAKIISLSSCFLPDTNGRKGDASMPSYTSKQVWTRFG